MAISRQNNVLTKLVALTGKTTLTTLNVQLAIDNWKNADFPRKLEMLVRRWMKAHGHEARHAGVIAMYAKLDEQSAKWLVDPVVPAQDAILKLGDEDDLALLAKRAINFSEISIRLWKAIAEGNTDMLPARTLTKLATREDAPARFVKMFAAPEKAEPVKTTRRARIEKEEVPSRGRTGKAQRVAQTKVRAVDPDLDLDDEDDEVDARPARRTKVVAKAKTVNKAKTEGAIDKIRKVVGPVKKMSRNVHMEEQMDVKKVRDAVRTVRRPRV